MKAQKLKSGDEIRILSPSRSMSIIAKEQRKLSEQQLREMGLTVAYSKHCEESDAFSSSSIESRVQDLHEAFLDPNVSGILTTIGGYNCNQILSYIDYDIIASNPKRLCGYSDITVLSSAIYAKTGLITYSGPHYSTFGMLHGIEYTTEYFYKMMFQEGAVSVLPSAEWSDDAWYMDQENRTFIQNDGPYVINEGKAEGVIIGGNLCTLNLLHGTEFMPSLEGAILFLEDDLESQPPTFDRDLQSLIHQPGFNDVKGIVIGRFQPSSQMNRQLLHDIIKSKKELEHLPVVADVNFGHTSPQITIPVGGEATLEAFGKEVKLSITE
ncbi:Muramoyltetrapeptide carboxypeptidase LdcA (peptidoglycan recycling) [Paenibacillus uliginis N3/975]|uniref:Muramoyltetrapeptide carboxypeptidase LdcA (Peptidoglycan recycling) n=1 Tax=Paenibacillus uliginis N3/975 TaxID=1313296 RepID=A0A1X7H6Q6_9BACL|nr:S66 peptidase family protein [Paenibacillus uliginis]SMF80739.1 Muramoyltetrapeptide carboxypeptidase LdcA (peptidoglycan recycling) [Paenibacillus uliginis N3/975]